MVMIIINSPVSCIESIIRPSIYCIGNHSEEETSKDPNSWSFDEIDILQFSSNNIQQKKK